jgi:hypothetical protein
MCVSRARLLALALAGLTAGAAGCGGASEAPTAQTTPVAVPATTQEPTVAATPTPSHRAPVPPKATTKTVAAPLYPLPALPAYPRPCPPPTRPPGPPPPPPPKPKVKTKNLPAPVPMVAHHPSLRAVSGKGMWLTTWQDSTVDVATVIAKARAAGLRQLWVRTGGTPQGFYGHRVLDRLLPAAHAAGIDVVAWDFPKLSDPVADAARAARTVTASYGGQRLDGFSPDIETINEGTFNNPARIRVYLSRVRAAAGNMPLVATVMRPTDYQLATYPYRAEAPYVDVFAPMVYWSCNEPGALAAESLRPLAKLRPVHLIGQSYDMADEGGRPGLPSGREIWRFLDVAKRSGAIGASLYLYTETRQPQWTALGRYPWG